MNHLKGMFTAIITPFKKQKIDYGSLEKLIHFQEAHLVDGYVVSGTTGESPTLSSSEVKELFRFIKKETKNKVLIVGTGSNSTQDSIANTQRAEKMGANAALVVVPYYNKPPQRGLYDHFKKIAESTRLPCLLYNVPGRTVTCLHIETIKKLSHIKNIVGIKEASGNIQFAQEIIRECGKNFILLSGDDGTYFDFLKVGGHGVISVASHVIPGQMKEWTLRASNKQFDFKRDFNRYSTLIEMLFVEANPIPVKKALQLMGLISSAELRLPMIELEKKNTVLLKSEMKKVGLL